MWLGVASLNTQLTIDIVRKDETNRGLTPERKLIFFWVQLFGLHNTESEYFQ